MTLTGCPFCTTECWRDVPTFNGYEVSCQGRVRSWHTLNGRKEPALDPRVLSMRRKPTGYLEVTLNRKNGTARGERVKLCPHHLVLLAFRGKPEFPATRPRHKNGNRGDNRLDNVEWATAGEFDKLEREMKQ